MAKLETQINQIYLTDPASKKTSLILYEEQISASAHLFVLAELWDKAKKTEGQDLKKISEIILASFRANKKLPAESMFESALAQINQNLADLAHEGRRSWVGKFSCLICLKSSDNIYLANDGQCGAWLHRKFQLVEILPPEKRGIHPLKTFVNFTQGKLIENDNLVISTSNIFNFLSLEHFTKILNETDANQACLKISKILQDSVSDTQAFCAFFLRFGKTPLPVMENNTLSTNIVAAAISEEIYAPLPEEIKAPPPAWPKLSWPPKLPQIKWPQFPNLTRGQFKFKWTFFNNLTRSGKFFFTSFTLFLILFLVNLTGYLINYQHKKTQAKIQNQINLVSGELTDAQSNVIYKNNNQALTIINQAQKDFDVLKALSADQAHLLEPRLENIKTQINKISTVEAPQILLELRHNPIFLGHAPTAFLFGNQDSNSLSQYNNQLKDYFLLNSAKNPITGIAFMPGVGVVVASGDTIYKIDQSLQQLEPTLALTNGQLALVRSWGNNLLVLDKANNHVLKISLVKNKIQSSSIAQVTADQIRDIGGDKDLYLLGANKLTKVSGSTSVDVKLPNVTDGITNATKIFIGSNIYILEADKKRIVIMTKTGSLLNQIYFPSTSHLHDFYIDESQRNIYLLDDNKLYKITF